MDPRVKPEDDEGSVIARLVRSVIARLDRAIHTAPGFYNRCCLHTGVCVAHDLDIFGAAGRSCMRSCMGRQGQKLGHGFYCDGRWSAGTGGRCHAGEQRSDRHAAAGAVYRLSAGGDRIAEEHRPLDTARWLGQQELSVGAHRHRLLGRRLHGPPLRRAVGPALWPMDRARAVRRSGAHGGGAGRGQQAPLGRCAGRRRHRLGQRPLLDGASARRPAERGARTPWRGGGLGSGVLMDAPFKPGHDRTAP